MAVHRYISTIANDATVPYTALMEHPANTILELSMSYIVPRCLHVVADIGVADALDESPRTAADLAASTGVDAETLGRVLRVLASYGVFKLQDRAWVHTPAS